MNIKIVMLLAMVVYANVYSAEEARQEKWLRTKIEAQIGTMVEAAVNDVLVKNSAVTPAHLALVQKEKAAFIIAASCSLFPHFIQTNGDSQEMHDLARAVIPPLVIKWGCDLDDRSQKQG